MAVLTIGVARCYCRAPRNTQDPVSILVAGQAVPRSVPGADLCRLTLVGESACLPLRMMQALLRGIEKIVLEAAYRDVELAEIPALTGLTPISADAAR